MKTFCVVDDDEIFKFLLRNGLRVLGYTKPILDFDNGKDALEHFKSGALLHHLPQVIFLDIKMYTMDGWDFLLEFREIKTRQQKPIDIYMISNSSLPKDFEKANSFNVTDYLVKPISIDTLKNILQ